MAIAEALGREGYELTIAARRPKRLAAALSSLRAAGLKAQVAVADVTKEEDLAALLSRHREAHGRLDLLVNNAGLGFGQPIESVSTYLLDKLVTTNLRGVVLCTREALPMLREAGAEHGKALIVNVASITGKAGRAGLPVYAASKAGVIAFSRSTQQEVAADGIQCTALAPGPVDTRMMAHTREPLSTEEMIQPEDLGEAVRLLLRTSPSCRVPEIVFTTPGGGLAVE